MNIFEQIHDELDKLVYSNKPNTRPHLYKVRELLCQARETLEALEAKQKTWEAKAENQVVQPEPEHSTPNNDQKSLEKEQSRKTRKPSKQYIVSVPEGHDDMAIDILESLVRGTSITHPNIFKIQVVNLYE